MLPNGFGRFFIHAFGVGEFFDSGFFDVFWGAESFEQDGLAGFADAFYRHELGCERGVFVFGSVASEGKTVDFILDFGEEPKRFTGDWDGELLILGGDATGAVFIIFHDAIDWQGDSCVFCCFFGGGYVATSAIDEK